jgi:hypothetical protein
MHVVVKWLLAVLLGGHITIAAALSNAPLYVLNAYIEQNGTCPEVLVKWNRKYNPKVMLGEVPRTFYYRVLGFSEWGACLRRPLQTVFSELQKVSIIFEMGAVSEAEVEAKETELINLLFSALADKENGDQMVRDYEATTASRLFQLVPDKQFFNCTYFGDKPKCAR